MRDTLATIGFGLLTFGFWRAWEPLGFIVPGVLLVAGAIYGHLRFKPRPPQQPAQRSEAD